VGGEACPRGFEDLVKRPLGNAERGGSALG
jgi:hypothetical protein